MVNSTVEEGNTNGVIGVANSVDTSTQVYYHGSNSPREAPSDNNGFCTDASPHHPLTLNDPEAHEAVLSLPSAGSAGGVTGIRPQHIQEMVNSALGPVAKSFLTE